MDYVWMMFSALMLHAYGVSAYISTTSRGYTSTETGDPFFECYRSFPDLQASVSIGRYVYVYNNINDPSNSPPPASVSFTPGDSLSQAFRINLDNTPHQSFGAFYCASTLDREFSVVPTLFLRSDAKFVPTSGRFSKTVNTGDVGVTVDFTEVNPTNTLKNWRFNGTTMSTETISAGTIFEELTVYTLTGEVDTTNGGVYELHLQAERGLARAGLLRLIVRACPAGRYDSSRGCTLLCPSCYNGGICHDETGDCICPPGFQGDSCEMACGGNRYGRDCEYRCDYELADDRTACSGLQVCVPDPYGCSCTPGYKGLDCTTECDLGEFGASCTETCHCLSGECDRFTGVCTGNSTECEQEWTGNNCQECKIGKYGPNCDPLTVEYTKTNMGGKTNFQCCLEGANIVSTADPVVNLHRKIADGNYTQEGIDFQRAVMNQFTGALTVLYLVEDVRVGEIFECSLSDVKEFWSEPLVADGEYILLELPIAPVVSSTTNNSITLMWEAWDAATDIGDPPLLKYSVYYRLSSLITETEVDRTDGLALSETVTGLSPDTDYVFGVAAWRPGVGGRGKISRVNGSTSCSPPTGVPDAVSASTSTLSGTIIVSWQNPPYEANCRSGLTGLRIYWESIESPAIDQGFADVAPDSSNGFNLTSLEPYTSYAITVAVLNQDAVGPKSEQSVAMTTEDKAPPPSEVQTLSTSSFIIVRWNASRPAHLNGNFKGYTISYRRIQPVFEEWQSDFIMTCQQVNSIYVIEGVRAGEMYNIRISTVNGVGSGEWSMTETADVTQIQQVDGSRCLRDILLTGLMLSAIALTLIIIIILLILKRRPAGLESSTKGKHDTIDDPRNVYDDTQSHGKADTYEEIQGRVNDDSAVYQELELTSVHLDESKEYVNMDKDPRGRKHVLKAMQSA